jgi:hypothetical protein
MLLLAGLVITCVGAESRRNLNPHVITSPLEPATGTFKEVIAVRLLAVRSGSHTTRKALFQFRLSEVTTIVCQPKSTPHRDVERAPVHGAAGVRDANVIRSYDR